MPPSLLKRRPTLLASLPDGTSASSSTGTRPCNLKPIPEFLGTLQPTEPRKKGNEPRKKGNILAPAEARKKKKPKKKLTLCKHFTIGKKGIQDYPNYIKHVQKAREKRCGVERLKHLSPARNKNVTSIQVVNLVTGEMKKEVEVVDLVTVSASSACVSRSLGSNFSPSDQKVEVVDLVTPVEEEKLDQKVKVEKPLKLSYPKWLLDDLVASSRELQELCDDDFEEEE